jgi:hypothetical protein
MTQNILKEPGLRNNFKHRLLDSQKIPFFAPRFKQTGFSLKI